jgi:hypothetical protein
LIGGKKVRLTGVMRCASLPGMSRVSNIALTLGLALMHAVSVGIAHAQPAPQVPDAARDLVGAWEISNADRDRRCGVTFSVAPTPGGYKLEFEAECATAIPPLKDVVVWALGPKDVVRLLDGRNNTIFEFSEVEGGLYEGHRPGEGLYFMQTQAALKIETRTPEQVFGDWKLLRELDKPLCTLTLSNTAGGGDNTYRIVVKPGCNAAIAGFGLTTWRIDGDQLVLNGRTGNWRFAESDPTTWERVPLSTDPLLLMK